MTESFSGKNYVDLDRKTFNFNEVETDHWFTVEITNNLLTLTLSDSGVEMSHSFLWKVLKDAKNPNSLIDVALAKLELKMNAVV